MCVTNTSSAHNLKFSSKHRNMIWKKIDRSENRKLRERERMREKKNPSTFSRIFETFSFLNEK